jgi:HSP20 family protein
MAQMPVEKKQAPVARAPDPFVALRTEMDRLFDRFSSGFGFPSLRRMFDVEPSWPASWPLSDNGLPAVDVTENATAYKITAELPGMKEKDIEVAVTDDTLTIKGEKREEHEEKGENRYLSERSYGAFQRSFVLPRGVDRDKLEASFANGVLTVTLPKTPEARKQEKKIEVKGA